MSSSHTRRSIGILGGVLISVLIIVGLSWLNDTSLGELWSKLYRVDSRSLCLMIIASIGTWLLRAARLSVLFASLSFQRSLYISATHNALTRIVPARAGELSLPVLLKQHANVPLAEGTLTMVWLRLIEIACLGCITAGITLVTMIPDLISPYLSMAVASLSLVIAMSARSILRATLLQLGRYSKRIKALADQLHTTHQLNRVQLILITVITCATMLCQALLFSLVLWSVGTDISYAYVLLGSIGVHLSGVLPAPTIGNVGTHEIGWTLIYTQLGVSASAATASAVISQWFTLLLAMLWWGLSSLMTLKIVR